MTGLLAALLLAAAPADAPEKVFLAEGQKLFGQGRFLEAVEKFEAAFALKPHPGLHYNLARCHEELGHTGKALKSYREYLRYMPKVEDRPAVEKSMAALQKKLADSGVQQLRVIATPSSASILVNSNPAGSSPAYVELPAGAHRLVVTAPGFSRYERDVVIALKELGDVSVELVAVQEEPPTPPLVDAAQPPPELVPKPKEPVAEPLAPTPEEKPKKGRVFTWVALGVGVAAAGTGLGFGLGANGASQELTSRPHPRPEADNLVQQTKTYSTTANVSWVVAGGAALTAVVLFFVEGAQ